MSIVNRPEVSGPLAWFYVGIVLFISAVVAYTTYLFLQQPQFEGLIIGLILLFFVEGILILILISFFRTEYILTEQELVLKASIFIGGTKRISLETVDSIQRTLIPFGVRLFGASFYGGYYYFPSVGKVFVVMTNFKDGVIIKSKHGNYLITPRKPESFIESIEKMRKSRLQN